MGTREIKKGECLDLVLNNNSIGAGSHGQVFDLGNGDVFKFYYEKFGLQVDGFQSETYRRDQIERFYRNVMYYMQDLYKIQETVQYKVMQLQSKVKRAALPKELIFVEGALVGCLSDLVIGTDLKTAMTEISDTAIKAKIEQNLYDAYDELTDNGIFAYDVKHDNVKINPKTLEAKVIDTDDAYTVVDTGLSGDELIKQKIEVMGRVKRMLARDVEGIPVEQLSGSIASADLLFRRKH